jgi:hypothetical protein
MDQSWLNRGLWGSIAALFVGILEGAVLWKIGNTAVILGLIIGCILIILMRIQLYHLMATTVVVSGYGIGLGIGYSIATLHSNIAAVIQFGGLIGILLSIIGVIVDGITGFVMRKVVATSNIHKRKH